jgi:hypothetical protein
MRSVWQEIIKKCSKFGPRGGLVLLPFAVGFAALAVCRLLKRWMQWARNKALMAFMLPQHQQHQRLVLC